MRAIITQPDGFLEWNEVDTPSIGEEEVLIRVAAAGVNHADLFQRMGKYPPPPGVSDIIGLEVSGVIAAVGTKVSRWKEGDAVCALLAGGGYAEYVAAPQEQLMAVPDGVTIEEASSLPEVYATVWQTLQGIAGLKKGETLLVHGGSSGIGSAAIQCAKLWGVEVFTTASTGEKCQFCEGLGARPVNYRYADYVKFVKAATNDKGVDVILDMVGGDYMERNFHAAAVGARIVQIAFLQGAKTQVNFAPLLLKRLTLTGSTLRSQSSAQKGGIVKSLESHIWPHFAKGQFCTVIDKKFAMKDAMAAHEYMELGQHRGKIILTV